MKSIGESVLAMQRAIEQRDEDEAMRRGISVDALHAEREGAIERGRAEADRRRRWENAYDVRSRIPDAVFASIVDGTIRGTAIDAVDAWIDSRESFVVLGGLRGSGKTVATVHAIARLGGVLVDGDDLQRAYRVDTSEAVILRQSIERAALLVVDDLGEESNRGGVFAAVQIAINHRVGGGLRTAFTTNLSRAEFVSRYGRRAAERIAASGRWVDLDDPNRRKGGSTPSTGSNGGKP